VQVSDCTGKLTTWLAADIVDPVRKGALNFLHIAVTVRGSLPARAAGAAGCAAPA
jgi:hypothetical protein